MTAIQASPTDDRRLRDYDHFDLHVDWLKNGWCIQNSLLQAFYEDSEPDFGGLLTSYHGYGNLVISADKDTKWSYAYKDLIVLSVDKTKWVDNLIINTLSFYEGELLRLRDLNLPDYHFEPFHVEAKNKTQLRAAIKEYGKHLHEKYSGDFGEICIRYY